MEIQRLKRVLAKEFTRNPGKTALLVVLIPVALYFIVPALAGKGGGKHKRPVVLNDRVLVPVPSATSLAVSGDTAWRTTLESIRKDVYQTPAELVGGSRDPFRFGGSVMPEMVDRTSIEEDDEEEVEQGDNVASMNALAGLRLTAVAIGPRMRWATINQRTYRETEPIWLSSGGGAEAPSDWIVSRVARDHVVLRFDLEEHRLQLRRVAPITANMTIARQRPTE